jgi:hypothetical protein
MRVSFSSSWFVAITAAVLVSCSLLLYSSSSSAEQEVSDFSAAWPAPTPRWEAWERGRERETFDSKLKPKIHAENERFDR